MANNMLRLGRLSSKTTGLFLCDMQEGFRQYTSHFLPVVQNSNRLLKAARILDMPVIATEQYPKGLGHSAPELELPQHDVKIVTKTCFTMISDEVLGYMKTQSPNLRSIILCGIEAHACIFQTTLDLLEKGYEVHLIADAVSSRNPVDRLFALRRLEKAGSFLTTSEGVILQMVTDAKHPKFKPIQKLIMDLPPDSGLISSLN